MKFYEIEGMYGINEVDDKKVDAIADSIRKNGWIGCPILIWNDQLLTGSHRLAALKKLQEDGEDVSDMEVAEDVTEIVEEAFQRFEEENGYTPDMNFDCIGWMLRNSWVEEYKSEISEW